MAATVITGMSGNITLPGGLVQEVSSISLNTGHELLDVSSYNGHGWRKRVGGLRDLAGTAVAFLSKGVAGSSPFVDVTAGSMTITFDTGCSITFDATIGNVTITGEYAGLNVVNFGFSKSDDVEPTIAWAAGT